MAKKQGKKAPSAHQRKFKRVGEKVRKAGHKPGTQAYGDAFSAAWKKDKGK